MENQHKLIKGYRELNQEEIDLMNRIKSKGKEMLELQAELAATLRKQSLDKTKDAAENTDRYAELDRFMAAEPLRWANIGKTDIQTGIMAMVRAVAQPSEC